MRLSRSRLRFRLSTLLFAVAAAAICLPIATWLAFARERTFWVDANPNHFLVDPSRFGPNEPNLRFGIVACLAILVAWPALPRRFAWAVVAINLLALLSWAIMRRWIVNPGSVLFIYPDDLLRLCSGAPEARYWRFSIRGVFYLFKPRTNREVADLLSLVMFFALFVSQLAGATSADVRARAALLPTGYTIVEWLSRMCSNRFWGGGRPPQIPFRGDIMPPASVYDFLEGIALFAVLGTLLLWSRRPARREFGGGTIHLELGAGL